MSVEETTTNVIVPKVITERKEINMTKKLQDTISNSVSLLLRKSSSNKCGMCANVRHRAVVSASTSKKTIMLLNRGRSLIIRGLTLEEAADEYYIYFSTI